MDENTMDPVIAIHLLEQNVIRLLRGEDKNCEEIIYGIKTTNDAISGLISQIKHNQFDSHSLDSLFNYFVHYLNSMPNIRDGFAEDNIIQSLINHVKQVNRLLITIEDHRFSKSIVVYGCEEPK
jgi:hypothetical protein